MYVVPTGFTPPITDGQNGNNPVIGYENLVDAANISAETEEAEYPASNLGNPNTSAIWRAADTTDQDIVFTLGGETIDYVAIARHNFGSAGVPITLSIDDGGSPASYATIIPEFIPTDDKPLILRFPPQPATLVKMRLNTGGTAPAQAAVVYIGQLLVLPRRIWAGHTPLQDGIEVDVANGISESGNFLGRLITGESRRSSLPLRDLDPEWYRANFRPFVASAVEEPFFFAWRPARYPLETGFAWLTANPIPTNHIGRFGLVSVDLQLGGIA